MTFSIPKSWKPILQDELKKKYVNELLKFLDKEKSRGKEVYPKPSQYFEALKETAFDKVKVVILGQDPYHGEGQAHGLSFSVKRGVKIPPSLRNIFKELNDDIGIEIPMHGCLESWANQGVLLLNATLSVEKGKAASHQKKGWEKLTDHIIESLNENTSGIVFMLWGAPAQKKGAKINSDKHLILTAPHPSPLSSYRGFFGCKHFSKANEYLKNNKKSPIDWSLC